MEDSDSLWKKTQIDLFPDQDNKTMFTSGSKDR